MKRLLFVSLFLLIAVSCTHTQDRWKLLTESSNGTKYYYDTKTIVHSKEIVADWHTPVEVWIKTVEADGSENMLLYKINCDNGKYSTYSKDNEMLEIEVLPPPESTAEKIVDTFCRRK